MARPSYLCLIVTVFFLFFHRILWKKNEVADYEATTFSIFYNNALYLVLLIVISFYIVKNLNPTVYPLPLSFDNKELTLLEQGVNRKEGGEGWRWGMWEGGACVWVVCWGGGHVCVGRGGGQGAFVGGGGRGLRGGGVGAWP